jgi:cell division protein FtsW (lipid II flippase)/cell division protein FtsI/penicillin-binding protein 2
MRVVKAEPVRRWRLPTGRLPTGRAARIERLGLAVTSVVILFGLALTFAEQASEFSSLRTALESERIVDLHAMKSSNELVPLLTMFSEPAERIAVSEAVHDRLAGPTAAQRLTHVGALAAFTMPAPRVRADRRLTVLNERLRSRGGEEVNLFTGSDIATLKPSLVVRTPDVYRRRILFASLLFIGVFWLTHLVRWWLGATGDPVLLPIVQLLTGVGVMAMIALRDPLRDTLAAVTVVGGITAGCLVWAAVSVIDFERPRLRREVLLPLCAAVTLAAALLLFGDGPTGSGAKVNLLGIQPVEVIRPLFIFSLAAYFARRWQFLRGFSEDVGGSRRLRRYVRLPRMKDVRPLAISIGTLLVFHFLQKDLGPALVLSCVFLGLYGMARGGGALVICGFLGLIAGLGAGYALGVPATITRRVAIWADPWNNALPGGDQISHAVWALASGGLPGLGLGVGDPQFIPAGHTDLIVAAIGEEVGFVGLAAVTVLFAMLVWRLLRVALRAPGDYTAFLTVGLTLAFAVQALVIVGGMMGLLPLAGVVTPFLSYGRSSMLSNLAAVGVCAAISCRRGAIRHSFAAPVRVLSWTLVAGTVVLLARMAQVEVVAADAFATRPNLTQQADGGYRYQYNPRLIAAARAIERGSVYDRTGLPLATSRHQELLPFANRYRRLGLELPSACRDDRTRCYPLGGLGFHVLGESVNQTNWAARNTSFVEKDFDARLKGFDDRPQAVDVRNPRTGRVSTVIKRDYAELLPLVRHKREPGHRDVKRLLIRDRDVHLTLDAGLQVMTARALRRRAESVGSGGGAAVVLDSRSGELLASASYPWPDDIARGQPDETESTADDESGSLASHRMLDRARYGLYPPGSTFKLVTATAALRNDPTEQRSTFQCERLPDGRVGGRVRGVSRPIRDDALDHVPHGRVDLHKALVMSCNPYFAQLAQRIGPRALEETASMAQIAVAARPVLDNLPRTLPHAGYGQGDVVASPLRMANVVAALASNGELKDVRVTSKPVAGRLPSVRWISAEGAAKLRGYMREVVTVGTGRVLAGHSVAIAGKTGTAEVDDARSHAWFVGFAPYARDRRQIAFAVVVENAGYGGRVAAPLAGDIVSAAQALGLLQ